MANRNINSKFYTKQKKKFRNSKKEKERKNERKKKEIFLMP